MTQPQAEPTKTAQELAADVLKLLGRYEQAASNLAQAMVDGCNAHGAVGGVVGIREELEYEIKRLAALAAQAEPTQQPEDEKALISNTIGFEFQEGELQTVNAGDLLRLVRAARTTQQPTTAAVCAHSWHDYGQLGGENVSYCGKCRALAFTGNEDAAQQLHATALTSRIRRITDADVEALLEGPLGTKEGALQALKAAGIFDENGELAAQYGGPGRETPMVLLIPRNDEEPLRASAPAVALTDEQVRRINQQVQDDLYAKYRGRLGGADAIHIEYPGAFALAICAAIQQQGGSNG